MYLFCLVVLTQLHLDTLAGHILPTKLLSCPNENARFLGLQRDCLSNLRFHGNCSLRRSCERPVAGTTYKYAPQVGLDDGSYQRRSSATRFRRRQLCVRADSASHRARKIGASVQTLTPELAEAVKLKGQLTTRRSHLHGRGDATVFTAVTVRAIDEPGKRVSDRSEIP
jgi:hypothetical protein